MTKQPNKLISSSSPYLRQHANNPVNWYPWGDEALAAARHENKIILVSIGYSACHWCHVMADNCFEDPDIASFMNTHFINIKVDREERPDIDQIFMNAVMLINGSGGWPLNAFALPDGRPFFGGTYFLPERWLELLKEITRLYSQSPEKLKNYATQLQDGISRTERIFDKEDKHSLQSNIIKETAASLKDQLDIENGGVSGRPKFPMPPVWTFLFYYYFYHHDTKAVEHALFTLDQMCSGGIYDHAGGGFARYSVDNEWRVPHFEKMLYDNAQFLSLYALAYKITGKERYKNVIAETYEFLIRELQSPYFGFYASLDADSEGKEGKFYVWDEKELDALLGEDAPLFKAYYSVNQKGAWEGSNILQISPDATHIIVPRPQNLQTINGKIIY